MEQQPEPKGMVKYQFEIEDEKWEKWKDTVPRSKSLETRIIELIAADTEGRVAENNGSGTASSDRYPQGESEEHDLPEPDPAPDLAHADREDVEHALRELGLPGQGDDLEARIEALLEMHDLLREHEGVKITTSQLKEIGAEFDHGYTDVDSFWTNCVKKNKAQGRENALTTLPGVQEASSGEYVYERE